MKGFVQAEYDYLVDLFNRGGELDIEEAREGLRRNLGEFLGLGCDVNQIMGMFSAEDIFMNYKVLTTYGAEINVLDLAKVLGDVFVMNHLEWFSGSGVDANELFEAVFDEDSFDICGELGDYFNGDFNKAPLTFIKFGVNIEKIFKVFQWWLEFRYDWEDELREGLLFFVEHGFSTKQVREWMDDHGFTGDLLWDIVVDHPVEWVGLGIQGEDYLEMFLDTYAEKYLEDECPLPEGITRSDILSRFSVRQIDFYGLAERRWDNELLVKKLMEEGEYSDNIGILCFMICENGSAGIDVEKLKKSIIDSKELDADDKACYLEEISTNI